MWKSVPGLQVLAREVIGSETAASMGHPGLSYSVVMPWIEGHSWADVLDAVRVLSPEEGLAVARATADVLSGLEQRKLVHADISSSNVIIQGRFSDPHIELIDVEDMYHPSLTVDMPFPPDGSPGYSHPRNKGKGCRNPYGDRFAGAILLTEMLTWHDSRVRDQVEDVSLFTDEELGGRSKKYDLVRGALARQSAELALLLDRAWHSNSLKECPTVGEWQAAVRAVRFPLSEAPTVRLGDLTAMFPASARRSVPPNRPKPQTSLLEMSLCPECGRVIPFRSPSSHAATCSHHSSQLGAKTFMAKYLESQPLTTSMPTKPPEDLWDLMRKYRDAAPSPSPAKPVPRFDDVAFKPITGGPAPAANPRIVPQPRTDPLALRFPGPYPPAKRPAPTRCDECFRTISIVDGTEKGHTWTCRKGPLAWVWGT
jgi:serine/threonine protein kinase